MFEKNARWCHCSPVNGKAPLISRSIFQLDVIFETLVGIFETLLAPSRFDERNPLH